MRTHLTKLLSMMRCLHVVNSGAKKNKNKKHWILWWYGYHVAPVTFQTSVPVRPGFSCYLSYPDTSYLCTPYISWKLVTQPSPPSLLCFISRQPCFRWVTKQTVEETWRFSEKCSLKTVLSSLSTFSYDYLFHAIRLLVDLRFLDSKNFLTLDSLVLHLKALSPPPHPPTPTPRIHIKFSFPT